LIGAALLIPAKVLNAPVVTVSVKPWLEWQGAHILLVALIVVLPVACCDASYWKNFATMVSEKL
jgi:hypothetical protein